MVKSSIHEKNINMVNLFLKAELQNTWSKKDRIERQKLLFVKDQQSWQKL